MGIATLVRWVLFFLLFLTARIFSQIPLDSLHGPLCGMIDPDTRQQVAINPVFTRVNVVITDAMAQATVTQRFVNPFKASSEAIYVFPLPDQGSVHGMRYQYRNMVYTATVMDRQKAQEAYDSAKNSGKPAALLLQDRPNIFMQRMANMGAGETSYVEIKLSMPLKYSDGEFEFSFPTRIGPRFQSGSPKVAAAAAYSPWNPPEDRAGPELQFNVFLQSGVEIGSVYSPSHPIDVGDLAGTKPELVQRKVIDDKFVPQFAYARGVLLQTKTTYPNRDYVLRMKRAQPGQEFSLASYRDPKAAGSDSGKPGYFMLNLYPDTGLFAGARSDLELVLLVDISGSQSGWPLEREKEISLNILSRLTPRDNLSVLAFSDQVYYAFQNESPAAASPANVAQAENFVRGLNTMGSTQLLAAVNASLAVPASGQKKRIYVFLTDGFITDETAILDAISKHPSKPTICTFGAGNNLNRYFLEECAKVGNGFATPVVQGDAVGPLVEAAWLKIESPQIDNLKVDFGGLAPTDVLFPISARLYRGSPYRVMGKYSQGGSYTITLSGDKEGKPISFSRRISLTSDDANAWAVPKLWAREKIARLTYEQGVTQANKPAIVAVSIEHQVLSQYTAFLALDGQPATDGNSISVGATAVQEGKLPAAALRIEVRHGLLYLDWAGQARVRFIRVYDLHGRLLFLYRVSGGAQISRWIWDGRDMSGNLMTAGRYLVRVETDAGVRSQAFLWNP